ncbi:DUF2207 domain-containing protein [Paenalkalicoccus suaedae]|uniref:DUF2207 domain-containing protein n=1 Tax=Paenalkalicoccus suaedae TaxID=2592382 RepID=A0A859FGJ4_9BACI|nr:DUF2207 domain-containing protein [Paenalkalicoccus suaedae]QKS71325.1 DUF2207 domain-containing protein [Paenalkalicoccus suaedae]
MIVSVSLLTITALLTIFLVVKTIRAPYASPAIKEIAPAISSSLVNGSSMFSHHLTATLLHLTQKGAIVLQKNEEQVGFRLGDMKTTLLKHERFVMEWLLPANQEGIFYPENVRQMTESEDGRAAFLDNLTVFEKRVKEDLQEIGFAQSFDSIKKPLLLIAFVQLIGGAASLFVTTLIGVLLLLASLCTFILAMQASWLTPKGRAAKEYVQAKKERLRFGDISDDQDGLTADYVEAIGLGLKQDYIKRFPLRETSPLRQDVVPLYAMVPGVTALSVEGVKVTDDMDAAFSAATIGEVTPYSLDDSSLD